MSLLDGMTALQVTVMKDHHKPCSLSVGIGVCGNLLKKKTQKTHTHTPTPTHPPTQIFFII
jgi:hypothetical protein